MQVQVDIGFDELLQIVKKLPATQLSKLKAEIDKEVKQDEMGQNIETFLLKAPTFSKKQMNTIAKTRKTINQWRTK